VRKRIPEAVIRKKEKELLKDSDTIWCAKCDRRHGRNYHIIRTNKKLALNKAKLIELHKKLPKQRRQKIQSTTTRPSSRVIQRKVENIYP
jgi:hypothetical protein